MTKDELKQELCSIKKDELLDLIESLMEDGAVDITDINLCHTRALERKLAEKQEFINEADNCIFESVFTDSIGKPADNAAILRKLKWLEKTGLHNMEGILKYLHREKNISKNSQNNGRLQ